MTDRYERIRAALEMGPTPGPWDGDDNSVSRLWSNGTAGIREYIALPDGAEGSDPNPADMHWIAACDPDTIRELLAERDQLAAALEAAREDAERYRWLRENCVDWAEDTDEPQLVHRDGGLWRTDWRERLDTAIDRARRPYNASGSLSEYGIFPECDAALAHGGE